MKLKELLTRVDYSKVEEHLSQYTAWDKEKGKKMFETLLNTEPVDSDLTIKLDYVEDSYEYDGEIMEDNYYHVYAEDGTQTWAIDFLPFKEVLGFNVDTNSMTYEEYVAPVLYEISFHGYDEETIKARMKSMGIIGEPKRLTVEQQKEFFDDI